MGYRKIDTDKVQHIYNRGCDKRDIFLDEQDHFRFMDYLIRLNTKRRVKHRDKIKTQSFKDNLVLIDCFTLMPNHFHLCLKEVQKGGIGKFVGKIESAYTNYFNNKYSRSGVLFQGEFKNINVLDQNQLEYLRIYIKNNPAKLINKDYSSKEILYGYKKLSKKEKDFVENYPYSKFFNLF